MVEFKHLEIKELQKLCLEVRKSKKISQQELADLVGCTRQTIRDFESGSKNTRFNTVVEICHVLGIELGIFPTNPQIVDCSNLNNEGIKKVKEYIKDIEPSYKK